MHLHVSGSENSQREWASSGICVFVLATFRDDNATVTVRATLKLLGSADSAPERGAVMANANCRLH